MRTKKTKMTHRLAAAVTVGMVAGASTSAHATASFVDAGDLVNNLVASSAGFVQLINLFGYIGGSGLAVAGIFKLKQHVDNPGQTPMKDGVMRLAAGGALLSLPFMVNVMQGSIGQGQSNQAIAASKISNFN